MHSAETLPQSSESRHAGMWLLGIKPLKISTAVSSRKSPSYSLVVCWQLTAETCPWLPVAPLSLDWG